MNDLHDWLDSQNGGLGTYIEFQLKTAQLAAEDRERAALYQLLSALAGRFVAVYDSAPLPTTVATQAIDRLRRLVEAGAACADGPAEEQLRMLNAIACADLAE